MNETFDVTGGPRARLERRLPWLGLGLLAPAAGIAIAVALLVVPERIEATLGTDWIACTNAALATLGAIASIHMLLAWRTGAAACVSGLPRLACRAFLCLAISVTLAGLGVLVLLPSLTTLLGYGGTSSHNDTQIVKLILVMAVAAPIAIGSNLLRVRRFLASAGLERVLPDGPVDRLAWFFYPLLSERTAFGGAGIAPDERLVVAFDGVGLTTKHLVVGSGKTAQAFPRERVADLGWELAEKQKSVAFAFKLVVRFRDGSSRQFTLSVSRKQPEGLDLVRFLLARKLPESLLASHASMGALAKAHLNTGEEILAAIPARWPKKKKSRPVASVTAGTVLTTGRLFAFDDRGVRASLELERHDPLVLSERSGLGLARRYGVQVWHGDRPGDRFTFKALTLDAYVLLAALVERFEPSQLVLFPSSQSRGVEAHVHIPIH